MDPGTPIKIENASDQEMTEVLSDNLVLVQDEEDREKVDFDSFLNQDEDEGQ